MGLADVTACGSDLFICSLLSILPELQDSPEVFGNGSQGTTGGTVPGTQEESLNIL